MTGPGGDPGEKPQNEASQPEPTPPSLPPSDYPPPAGYGPPGHQDASAYGAAPYQPIPPEYGQPYPEGYPPSGYPGGQPGTNTLAIASLIASLVGLLPLCGIGSIVGIVLGGIAISQIKRTQQAGYGMAVAGIVVGAATLVVGLIIVTYRMH
jgi:Domain of unknown function (DUF4190)